MFVEASFKEIERECTHATYIYIYVLASGCLDGHHILSLKACLRVHSLFV